VMNFSETNRPTRFYKAMALSTPLFYACNLSGTENGGFMIFARTNDTLALVGTDSALGGIFANALGVSGNSQCCGTLFANRVGCLAFTSNSISGSLSNGASRVGTISGTLSSNSGQFQPAAGLYSGGFAVFDGADCDGTLKAILAPDGTFYLYVVYPSGLTDGGSIVIAAGGGFTVLTPRGSHFTGTLNISQRAIFGSFTHGCDSNTGTGPFSLSRSEKLF
jgi:hypothetical protein